MLSSEIALSDGGGTTPGGVTAAVYFAGDWKGAVLIECSPQQAFEITARLLGSTAPRAMDEDVRDALGELANMVAGNLKSVLPRGVGISMPSVVEGTDYSLKVCGGNLSTRLRFSRR
jgi:chemotaxis protein CheX